MGRPVASFPHMGNYAHVIKDLAQLVDCDVMVAPPITRRTLEVGTQHSPEFVCVPFKYTLGNFIEALDAGADVLIQAGGGCRFSYYGEIQETILRSLGYEFDFIQLSSELEARKIIKFVRRHNKQLTPREVKRVIALVLAKVRALDEIEDIIRRRIGFEVVEGGYDRLLARFLSDIVQATTLEETIALGTECRQAVEAIEFEQPESRLKVGVIGELYVVIEPFSNMNIERYLAKRGVEVDRHCTVSSIIRHAEEGRSNIEGMLKKTAPYVTQHLGAEGTASVYLTLDYLERGYDGMVHLKPFGCMPEVNAMSALQRISRERGFPILFMSYDSQTSETGVLTRIEAFCDMLEMRKRGRIGA